MQDIAIGDRERSAKKRQRDTKKGEIERNDREKREGEESRGR